MKKKLLEVIADFIVRRYGLVLVLLGVVGVGAFLAARRLELNSNQIELLDPSLRPVRELHRITKMTGGTGFLMLAIQGDDADLLKRVSDDLAASIRALPEVRSVTYKQEGTGFIRKNIALFLKTEDLERVRKDVKRKIRAEIRKQNPFGDIGLAEVKPVELDFSDLIEKYRSMGKKGIWDDYYISEDLAKHEDPAIRARYESGRMLLLLIKPQGESTDLEFTRALIGKLDRMLADYSAHNPHGATLKEGYGGKPADGANVTYGYTGGYKLNLDDLDTIQASLVPTSVVALVSILTVLMFFLRRPVAIALLVTGLLYGMLCTFGFAALAVQRLNLVTATMGCILQGLGIDYGVHLYYRLREEYVLTRDLGESIRMAVVHSGSACAATVVTTAAAFFVMMGSEFRGFSDFGLIAGVGVVIIALSAYLVVPTLVLLLTRLVPSFPDRLLGHGGASAKGAIEDLGDRRFAAPGLVLGICVAATLGLGYLGRNWDFDYNARTLMVPDQPSIVLQQEINDRFQISSDPVAIYSESEADYHKLYDAMHPADLRGYASLEEVPPEHRDRYTRFAVYPLDRKRFSTVDEVISLCMMVPPKDQQERNHAILADMQKDLARVKRERLEPKDQEHFDLYAEALQAKPFDFATVAATYGEEWRAVPDARDEYPGWLTFVYPKVSLWDGRDLLDFADQVGVIRSADGTEFHATGIAILFAKLASIVLTDARQFSALTLALVFLLVLANFRRLGATLIALVPLGVGIIWMTGLMQPVGLQFNFINIVVLPLVLGYGIDTGIHVYHRFIETGSVMRAVRMTGGAVMASMLTTIAGWGALAAANHRGLQSMGELACIGIGSSLVVSLTLLPAILQLVADRAARKARALRLAEPTHAES